MNNFFPDSTNQPEPPILQAVLEPLLDDFQYWFSETQSLLASAKADCLADGDRQGLAQELDEAQQAVATARTLMLATDGNAGVELDVVSQWHRLVNKCWQTSRYIRQQHTNSAAS